MDNSSQPLVEVKNLECHYDDEVILQDVNFSVARKEIFFVAGRSGCGKTTLLRHMIGLLTPVRGTIWYFGKNFTESDIESRRELERSFGVLFQNDALWSDRTLGENVELPLILHTNLTEQTRAEIVALKLSQVGLGGCEDRFPRELSGGMRKRAALARALALDPAILFFDEPTAGLDPITARQIDELIMQVRKTVGATVIVISHSIPSIFHIADRIILLDPEEKGIIASGPPEELVKNDKDPRVREFLIERIAGKDILLTE